MGYNNQSTVYGNQGVGTTFMKISGDGCMGDLSVSGYGDEYADNGINCCKLNISGESLTTMYWVDYSEDGETWKGWYNDDWSISYNESVLLAPGEGLWFNSPSEDCKVVSAGQVANESIPVTLVYGNQLCPNPTPVQVAIEKAWISGYGDEYADNGINCCKLNISGESLTMMYWVDYSEDGETWYGWYNDDWSIEYNKTVTLNPGESIWLNSPADGWILNWTAPLAAE